VIRFDRMLAAQARHERLTLVTADLALRTCPIEVLWGQVGVQLKRPRIGTRFISFFGEPGGAVSLSGRFFVATGSDLVILV
jgi:hypothetical protein